MEIHIARPGQTLGPYSLEEVNSRLSKGSLSADDLAWFSGSSGWIPLSEIEGVKATCEVGNTNEFLGAQELENQAWSKSLNPAPPPSDANSHQAWNSVESPNDSPSSLSNWVKDIRGRKPLDLVRTYPWQAIAIFILLCLIIRFAVEISALICVISIGCLIAGFRNPEKWHFLFGKNTSKRNVTATFGALAAASCAIFNCLNPEPSKDNAPAPSNVPAQAGTAPIRSRAASNGVAAGVGSNTPRKGVSEAQLGSSSDSPRQKDGGNTAKPQFAKNHTAHPFKNVSSGKPENTAIPTSTSAPDVDLEVGVSVNKSNRSLIFTNQNDFDWGTTTIYLNYDRMTFIKKDSVIAASNYFYTIPKLTAGAEREIRFSDFANKDGRYFDLAQYKLERIFIESDTPSGQEEWDRSLQPF